MRSAFFGFHVAASGIHTARALLNVTGHNIANAEIPGFSRQVGIARANQPLDLRDSRGMYGTGSRLTSVVQIRDIFLDKMFWSQRATHGQFTAVNNHLTFIETVFNELPGSGVMSSFNEFFQRVYDATARAESPTDRAGVVYAAHSLTEIIRHNAQSLQRQQQDLNREVSDTVTIINSLGVQIRDLNDQIMIFERDGSNANDLRDQRALLIDELSQLVNIHVEERDLSTPKNPNDRRLSILINGVDFVNHTSINQLAVVRRENRLNEMDVEGLYDIRMASGAPFNIFSPSLGGTLRGLIDVRDGNGGQHTFYDANDNPIHTTRFRGIPFYMNQLNNLVRTFARAMNEGRNVNLGQMDGVPGHMNGYDAHGANRQRLLFTWAGGPSDMDSDNFSAYRLPLYLDANGNVTLDSTITGDRAENDVGVPLYTMDYSWLNAFNFIVNEDILRDDRYLAASDDNMGGVSAHGVLQGFNAVNNDRSLFREGGLIDFIISVSDHLAVSNRQAINFRIAYEEITMQTHNHRLSIKGVDSDEEMLNLVRFQQMLISASRLVNVIDTIYDTIINRLGNF